MRTRDSGVLVRRPEGRVETASISLATNDGFTLHRVTETAWKRHPLFSGPEVVK